MKTLRTVLKLTLLLKRPDIIAPELDISNFDVNQISHGYLFLTVTHPWVQPGPYIYDNSGVWPTSNKTGSGNSLLTISRTWCGADMMRHQRGTLQTSRYQRLMDIIPLHFSEETGAICMLWAAEL